MSRYDRTVEERIEEKIVRAKASHLVSDECWLWQGARTGSRSGGYAAIKVGGMRGDVVYVHRLMCEKRHGPLPEGREPDHICGVRNCVNPDHLEPVTRGQNIQRGYDRRAA
jgi:hypothetical protein